MSRDAGPFDRSIERLLTRWEPTLGRPTCRAGCSNCCRTTSVQATSGEVVGLLEFLDRMEPARSAPLKSAWRVRAALVLAEISGPAANPLGALVGSGPCIFLDGDRCGVYPARPDTCRAFHVWHSAKLCGDSGYEMCLPAELAELRTKRLFAALREECAAGRLPFYGHLLPMVDLVDSRLEEYRRGEDLARYADRRWMEAELITFLGCSRDGIEASLRADEATLARIYEEEPWPLGHPRADFVTDRAGLAAFPCKPGWRARRPLADECD